MAMQLEDQILDKETVETRLKAFEGWEYDGRKLHKTYDLPSFMEAIGMVNRVAEAAEKLNHHPDFEIHYKRLTLSCWTHKHNAISEADLALIKEIESAA